MKLSVEYVIGWYVVGDMSIGVMMYLQAAPKYEGRKA